MHRPWLDAYPPGMPAEIELGQHDSLPALLEASCERFGALVAYENLGARLSYAELDRRSRDFAAFLQQRLGLAPGERVALMLPNLLSFPVACMGALRAGLVVVPVNPLYTARELEHQLRDSGASTIVVLESFASTFAAVASAVPVKHVLLVTAGDLLGRPKRLLINFLLRHVKRAVPPFTLPDAIGFESALGQGRGLELEPVRMGPDDIAFLQYTGGTTGLAKGAVLSHGNLLANLAQARAWLARHLEDGREVAIGALPLYHIFALLVCGLLMPAIGARTVLVTNPRDLPAFVKTLRKTPFSVFIGVNTLFNALLDAPGFEGLDFSRLELVVGGGMAVQRSTAERWQRMTGKPIVEAYGLTEASPAVCANRLDTPVFTGAVGLPLPSTDLVIRDAEGRDLPIGEVGEICVRGPQVMRGYWNRPEASAEVLDPEGWLLTGDIGLIDNRGFVFIQDRKKDMILVSGFNVYPNEIEDVVTGHPEVREAAAIGVPHPRSGEAVKLFVVPRSGALSKESLADYCRERLAAYKCPREIEFRDSLPKNNVGKVLRRALREPEA